MASTAPIQHLVSAVHALAEDAVRFPLPVPQLLEYSSDLASALHFRRRNPPVRLNTTPKALRRDTLVRYLQTTSQIRTCPDLLHPRKTPTKHLKPLKGISHGGWIYPRIISLNPQDGQDKNVKGIASGGRLRETTHKRRGASWDATHHHPSDAFVKPPRVS